MHDSMHSYQSHRRPTKKRGKTKADSSKAPMFLIQNLVKSLFCNKNVRKHLKRRKLAHGSLQKGAVSTSKYIISTENILNLNRRSVPNDKIGIKLKEEFEDAQAHLDECPIDASYWNRANPAQCKAPYASKKIHGAGIAHMQGMRPTMEDTHIATIIPITLHKQTTYIPVYGIFDGHGGEACAKFLSLNLKDYLKNHLEKALASCHSQDEEIGAIFNVLKVAFVNLGAEYLHSDLVDGGSTANIALKYKNLLWVANVGDTRAILILNGQVIALSEDSKPGLEKYKRGVERRLCRVIEVDGVQRVEGNLATARAVGHKEKTSGINPRAKVIVFPLSILSNSHSILLIGCDGIWDVTSSRLAARTVEEIAHLDSEEIAVHLIQKAFEAGSTDNLSALVLKLSS